jgi:hypothetical protein
MSLLDDARDESRREYGCAVSRLDPALRAEVEEALEADGVTGVGLERALAKRGVQIKSLTLRRHLNGGCSCEPR